MDAEDDAATVAKAAADATAEAYARSLVSPGHATVLVDGWLMEVHGDGTTRKIKRIEANTVPIPKTFKLTTRKDT